MSSNDSKKPRRRGTNSEKGFKPYHSVSVPKHVDLVHQSHQEDKPKTTVMLRNIPNRYSQVGLLKEINAAGFTDSYDFFYLPMDTKNRTNVGYAFINFLTSQDLDRFMTYFAGYVFPNCPTPKAARVSLAHIQGFIENIRHFSNRAVSHSRNSQYRPIVIHKGTRMDISEAYDLLCTVQAVTAPPERPAYPQVFDPPPGLELPWTQMHLEAMEDPVRAAGPMAPMAPIGPMGPMGPVLPRPRPAAPSLSYCEAQNFCEAKRGFEEAISMFLASYNPIEVAHPSTTASMASVPVPIVDDDEQTDCEASVSGTPRGPGIFSPKFELPGDAHDHDDGAATPRTNKTLFVHGGRFSA
ncbi:unnamed protein product [Cladocopium goreaui]|uniref:Mei2-like C-terminal RNA recognition motif domain-containing protein n=1 Tax=Cladocopium goreaui TaxID=2562237 RepID=A0A9P1CLG6_9DINO|nr:unnamed protein product [Cladocopium goreaui]